MKKRINILILAVAAMMAVGCEKVVEFDMGDIEPKVVVNSLVQMDSTISMKLTYSRFFLEGGYGNNAFRVIDNAAITLLRNGMPESVTGGLDGIYTSSCKPQPGDTLSLVVSVPGHEEITSGCRIPSKANYEVVDFEVDSNGRWGDIQCRLRLKINDVAGERNFYRISALGWDSYWDSISPRDRMKITFECSDPVFGDATNIETVIDGGDNTRYGQELDFADTYFEGSSHVLTITFSIYDYLYYDGGVHSTLPSEWPIELFVTSISEELYRYSQTKNAAEGELFGLFSEPVQVYSNIKGGVGIFAAQTTDKCKLVPRYSTFANNRYEK